MVKKQNFFHILTKLINRLSLIPLTSPLGGVVSRSASAQVEIAAVSDSKPQFTQSTYRGTIEEESDPGTMILKVNPSVDISSITF